MVGQLTSPTTLVVDIPEKTMIAIAPRSAMPVRLSFNPGTCPNAMPR